MLSVLTSEPIRDIAIVVPSGENFTSTICLINSKLAINALSSMLCMVSTPLYPVASKVLSELISTAWLFDDSWVFDRLPE